MNIGDKESSFIGSKQWIGSTEVGFVLETLLSVTIKVITTNSGDEMPSIVPDLEYHFQTQGTPVMIGKFEFPSAFNKILHLRKKINFLLIAGGGVLAHTILGVSNDKETGDVRFLILDPHYTGTEQISTIVNKGWCGWKKKDFWRKDAFYNMCLPQRPKCI